MVKPMKNRLLFVLMMLGVRYCAQGASTFPKGVMADVVLRNGVIYTVNLAQPRVEAIAVIDSMIIFEGSMMRSGSLKRSWTTFVEGVAGGGFSSVSAFRKNHRSTVQC